MMFFAPRWGQKVGIKNLCAYGLLAAGGGNLILYLLHTKSVWLYLAVQFISGIGTTFLYLLTWAFASEAIGEVWEKHGVNDAYGYSVFSFMRKLGHCVAAVFVNLALWRIGYSGNVLNNANITQPILAEMYLYSVLVPALLYLVIFVLLKFFYPLGNPAGDGKGRKA